ncbi:MAG: hypothetical protein EOP54_05010 [Sphingobacteriales bacterium]|nr:MAG: hypothetical protein EOP54_05010 [Sphingobacteriales bacterium]
MNFSLLKNTKALSYTAGIHLVLLLIFFFVKYESVALPAPPPEELIELETVALGVDADGFGIEPPEMAMGMPAPPATPAGEAGGNTGGAAAANQTEIPQADEAHDDVAAVDHPTAAPVLRRSGNPDNPKPNTVTNNRNTSSRSQNNNNSNNNRNKSNNTSPSSNNRTAAQQAKYTFDGASGTGGNGAPENAAGSRNRGDGQGNGQKGQPGGDPNSVNFSGGITGRNIVAYPSPQAEFKDGGRVTIKVWVNRDGAIIRHEVQSAKNATLRAIAEQKIRNVKFNKKPDAAVEQSGILTFNFKAGTGR